MSTLERGSASMFADRFTYDEKLTISEGWAQIDTWQDASYFGVWCNPIKREIFTYCEGDLTLEKCESDEDFRAALEHCLTFYGRSGTPTKIDAAFCPELAEKFHALGFKDRVH